jgi:hypothetical protein
MSHNGVNGRNQGGLLLTERRKQQAIRDLMGGLTPDVTREALSDPYDYLWDTVTECQDYHEAYQTLTRFALSTEEEKLKRAIEAILSLEAGQKIKHLSLKEIGPDLPEVTWFWPGWIPRGMLTLLAASPGIGKTYLALDIARRLAADEPAPDDKPFERRAGNVIYVDAEDFLPAVYARAVAWGMDTQKFYPIRRPPRDLIDMAAPHYQDALIEMCYDLRPDLVIVDSLSSVNSKGENNVEDIREVLGFFVELPQAFSCGLVLIHHLRKPPKGQTQPVTMHDLRGSGHLVAMARSILALDIIKTGYQDDPNGPRQLRVLKTNLCKYPKPLSCQYESMADHPDVAMLTYGPIDLFQPIRETLAEQCSEWLLDLLEGGDLTYRQIKKLAAMEGYKENVLQDARKLLDSHVIDTVGPRRKGNKWALSENLEEN